MFPDLKRLPAPMFFPSPKMQAKVAADMATGRAAVAPAPAKTTDTAGTSSTATAAATATPPPPPGPKRAGATASVPTGKESKQDAAALRKLHLALTADGGVGGTSGGGGGVGVGGEGLAIAVADGYKPSPYLQEVMQVLEDTKVREGAGVGGWDCGVVVGCRGHQEGEGDGGGRDGGGGGGCRGHQDKEMGMVVELVVLCSDATPDVVLLVLTDVGAILVYMS